MRLTGNLSSEFLSDNEGALLLNSEEALCTGRNVSFNEAKYK